MRLLSGNRFAFFCKCNSYVTLNVKKNDGHVVKSEGIVNDDGTATVPLSQMLDG